MILKLSSTWTENRDQTHRKFKKSSNNPVSDKNPKGLFAPQKECLWFLYVFFFLFGDIAIPQICVLLLCSWLHIDWRRVFWTLKQGLRVDCSFFHVVPCCLSRISRFGPIALDLWTWQCLCVYIRAAFVSVSFSLLSFSIFHCHSLSLILQNIFFPKKLCIMSAASRL